MARDATARPSLRGAQGSPSAIKPAPRMNRAAAIWRVPIVAQRGLDPIRFSVILVLVNRERLVVARRRDP
jgi:hypothetical protein